MDHVPEVIVSVDGADDDLDSLWEWLGEEPALSGRLRLAGAPAADGEMGSLTDVVVQGAATLAGAGAVWAALSRSVAQWMIQRRSDVSIEVTAPGRRRMSLDAKRVADPEKLLREFLSAAGSIEDDHTGETS